VQFVPVIVKGGRPVLQRETINSSTALTPRDEVWWPGSDGE